ncbi:spore coat-associated protein [Gracilibacillus halophilus YIM-C55.5]|uniref:Spore coat-associated protein n=1 Tax=Gracilibacillus halophilus YIM-C55.5 TaxID=1308866 RepID=N4WVI4_9BACI|nr:CalY family protein [Gracilibacillus halophilus]ENH98410.1 spore coat-associated protein [Gracilibacillus halophilus YIM-C55.5]
MSLKKKLGLGIGSAALGLALVSGGTYAYFSDQEQTNNTFASGTLDLSVDPTTIIDVENLKPGDWMNRSFDLINDGSLDISSVNLLTDYTVTDANGDNVEDFGDHLRVNFFWNDDKSTLGPLSPDQVAFQTTLSELKDMDPDTVANEIFLPWTEEPAGLEVGDSDTLYVQFEFVDNGEDQNEFQGDALELEWTFEAQQTEGEER